MMKPGRSPVRTEFLIAIGLTILLIALHLVQLFNAGPLWRDEISSLSLATRPTWGEVWAAMVYDPFPLQYFVLLRGWSVLIGATDLSLRIFGCLVGLSCLAALWLSTRLTGKRTPILALAIFAFSPTLITWGDTLRGYGLGVFWILITFGCFVRLVQRPGLPATICAALAAILSVQAMFTNALLVFSIGMAAAAVASRKRDWKCVLLVLSIGLVAALSLIPYAGVLQAGQGWAASRKDVVPITTYLHEFQASLLTGGLLFWWGWLAIITAAAGLGLWAQRAAARKEPSESSDLALFGLVAGGMGFLATLAFFRVLSWPTHVWYYLPCLAIFGLSADLIFASTISSARASLIRICLALLMIGIGLPAINSSVQTRASNLDVIASILRKTAAPQDLVVLNPFTDGITFQRYFHEPIAAITVPIVHDLTIHRWDEVVAQARNPEAMREVFDKVGQTLRSGHKVWLVSSFTFIVPPRQPPAPLSYQEADPRPLAYFQGSWNAMLAYNLMKHSTFMQQAQIELNQPISVYEDAQLFQFSGWKDGP